MREGWRWYGPLDVITLAQVAQTGARAIVTALHDIPYGEVWDRTAIAARRDMIARAGPGMDWAVVESLPVHERIKRGDGDLSQLFANYRQSMANLAAEGIRVICYNFMPLIDWTRTDLTAPAPGGGTALRFDQTALCMLDVCMLNRDGAADDFTADILNRARARHDAATDDQRAALIAAVMAGLPGAYDRYDLPALRAALRGYAGIDAAALRANYGRFLDQVVPTAAELGLRLCVHPDDPPKDILGLPRIVSDADDIGWIMARRPEPENGLTLCSGSLGANPANDVPAIARRFADRIHFAHLRNVTRDPDGSFQEAAHLDGDTDMAELVAALLQEEARRRKAGRDDAAITFRPDHGHELLTDAGAGAHPGYPLIGRMRGLAELRGVIAGLTHARA